MTLSVLISQEDLLEKGENKEKVSLLPKTFKHQLISSLYGIGINFIIDFIFPQGFLRLLTRLFF